jgi:hypothetical protein
MDNRNIETSLTSPPKPKPNMADAMRAALQVSSPPPESSHERDMYASLRASYDAVNALLDQELAAERHPIDKLPQLLRLFKSENNVGDFADMVEFTCTRSQIMVNWRNCAAHMERLAAMNLSDPQAAFKKMEFEAYEEVTHGGNNTAEGHMSGVPVATGAVLQQAKQTPAATLLHPSFAYHRPRTPDTLLSPYSTPQPNTTVGASLFTLCGDCGG